MILNIWNEEKRAKFTSLWRGDKVIHECPRISLSRVLQTTTTDQSQENPQLDHHGLHLP
jgi:hypothetical protein